MIQITDSLFLDENELEWIFVRASGPGGQNVNKVATAAQLRFDITKCGSIPPDVKARLRRLAGRRLTDDGVLILDARQFRTQERNRDDAVSRLVDLIQRAAVPPKRRRKTRPTAGSRERRLEGKRVRAETKRRRGAPPMDD
jgi:ribosome-associated protein